MGTTHNNAQMGDLADLVLMPGDPLRAKNNSETILEQLGEMNNQGGMLGFNG
ncbi:purine-nucleoside phosphorylase, partial [Enterobacter intestinihominis]